MGFLWVIRVSPHWSSVWTRRFLPLVSCFLTVTKYFSLVVLKCKYMWSSSDVIWVSPQYSDYFALNIFVFFHQFLLQYFLPVFFCLYLDDCLGSLSSESMKLTILFLALMLFLFLVFYQYSPIFILNLGDCSQFVLCQTLFQVFTLCLLFYTFPPKFLALILESSTFSVSTDYYSSLIFLYILLIHLSNGSFISVK